MLSLGVTVRERSGMRYLRVSLLVGGLFAVAEVVPTTVRYLIQVPDEADTTLTLFLWISVLLVGSSFA